MKENNVFKEIFSENELRNITGGNIQGSLMHGYKGRGPSSAYEAYKYSNSYKYPKRPGYATTWSR